MPGAHACLLLLTWAAFAQTPEPTLPAVVVIGDSTANNTEGRGWGDPFASYFDPALVRVVNRARAGRSSRTFFTEGLWDKVAADLKTGDDVVIMQFGHNDDGPLDDAARARGMLRGVGGETREIDNPITKQHEVVHTYGWYLRQFIAAARECGATAIGCSPVPRMNWDEGKIRRNSADYALWARQTAEAGRVAFIDLNARIADRYDVLGPDKVAELFFGDHTHASRAGAELNAAIAVAGLQELANHPIAGFLRP